MERDLATGCLLAATGPLPLLALPRAGAGTGTALSFCATADEATAEGLAGPAGGAGAAITGVFPAPIPMPPTLNITIGYMIS